MTDDMNDTQKRYIEEHFRKKSDKEIAKDLGIANNAVRNTMKSMGLKRTKDEELQVKKRDSHANEGPRTNGWINLLCIFTIITVVFIAYANSLQNDFVWDDEFLVRDNAFIRSFSHIKDIFTSYLASSSGNVNNFYRPIQDLSYMTDYFLWGYDPKGFHLTNVLLHAICAVLVYILFLRILSDYKAPFLTAVLFGIHPINTEAVTYVAGRADSLYLLFFLLSFILFLKTVQSLERHSKMEYGLYILSLFCYFLSILSKEIGIILPLILILYHAVFLKNSPVHAAGRKLYLPYFVIFVLYLFLRKTALDFSSFSPSFAMAKYPLYQRMLTTSKAIAVYLRLLILPFGLHMERNVKVARSLFEPGAFSSLLILVVIFFGVLKAYKKDLKSIFFASMWFFAGLLPVSNIVPINSFIAEHWVYLSAIGVFAIAGMGMVRLLKSGHFFKIMSILVCIGAVFFYIFLTIDRNKDWRDEVTFFKDTIKYAPNNERLHLNFGNTYLEHGMKREALEEYKRAIELRPNNDIAYANIGSVYISEGRLNEARINTEKALSINPRFPQALFNLGVIYHSTGNMKAAEESYEKALELHPDFLNCHMNLASLYLKKGEIEEAKKHWREALRINPNEKEARRYLEIYR